LGSKLASLGEGRSAGRERAVDLVGRDVEKAECGLFRLRQLRPVLLGAVEEAERAGDVGLDEGLGRIDGAVDVGLGGEVDDGVDRVLGEERVTSAVSPMSPWAKT
jgi:hypothetical protein